MSVSTISSQQPAPKPRVDYGKLTRIYDKVPTYHIYWTIDITKAEQEANPPRYVYIQCPVES